MNEELSNLKKELRLIEKIANAQEKLLTALLKRSVTEVDRDKRIIKNLTNKILEAKQDYIEFLREKLRERKKEVGRNG